MKKDLEQAITVAVKELFDAEVAVELARPDEQFGDYATNVALQLAGKVGKNPREVAEQLAVKLRENLAKEVSEISIAGPGFLNLKLTDLALVDLAMAKPTQPYASQEVLVEFGDPNPFKAMHIGHLYSYVVGDAICHLLEAAGATVKRLSYHGDVGLHVAKAIWGMQHEGYDPKTIPDPIKNNIGMYYAAGARAYEESESAKQEINTINQQVYTGDPTIKELYEQGKTRSFGDFDETLKDLGVKTDKRYLESESAPAGLETVKQNIGKVFKESEGAIVYEGERVGLHTRVFVTSKGLPTYETKDLGLTELKQRDYPDSSLSIIITANEQAEYFKVMLAALMEIDEQLASKTKHLSHGFVSLSSGKMSSRTGEVYSAVSLLADVEKAMEKLGRGSSREVKLGAIKYAFTKHRLGSDLVYDISESLSLEGNSGPYLQYAHARARSILVKAEVRDKPVESFEAGERSLLRKLGEYAEVVEQATNELMPHHICTYLYELAQKFNSFYEKNRVIGDPRQEIRLQLVQAYADTLKNGLELLGIAAPDKM
jgi:arginyl-tRNA synthetase